jgi:photosystem II stability/assembly factor-like uncharacterized protein
LPQGRGHATVYAVSVSVSNMGMTQTLARSTDTGETFTALRSGDRDQGDLVFAVAPSTPTTLLLGDEGGLLRSTDGGATWTPVSLAGFTPTTAR